MNAVIEPRNAFSFGKVARDGNKGTATVSVRVPNAGTLVVGGNEVRRASQTVSAPGVVRVKIGAKGKKLRTLNKTGKMKVAAKVTFTPTGGDPKARSTSVQLKKR
jgi:hypothetical protein